MAISTRTILRKKPGKVSRTLKQMAEQRYVYFIFLPVLAYYILFCYMPMFNTDTGGIMMAFKHFRYNTTFADMEWVGLGWFKLMIGRPDFWVAMRNTLIISFSRLIIEFPMPIIIAVLLNEVRHSGPKRIMQTIFTFPNFLSWILVIGVMRDLLQVDGVVNGFIRMSGGQPYSFLATEPMMPNILLLLLTNIWKSTGWSAIIYMAAITAIDPSLYEAAIVDGANRWHCIRYVTWPCIKATAVVLLILNCGGILNAGFDQIFNLKNGINRGTLQILDTYIYDLAFSGSGGTLNQGFTVAAGLFKSVINFALLMTANLLAKALNQEGLF